MYYNLHKTIGGITMADNVTIQINMTNGEIHIQAPAESLDTIFDKLETFLPKLADIRTEYVPEKTDFITVEEGNHSASVAEKSEQTDIPFKNSTKRKRASSSKKTETFNMVELGLDENSRYALREFYSEKNPKNQNEQLLVVMDWLKRNAGKTSVTKDEIYTALRTVEAKIPARISSVLSNLGIEGKITGDADGYRIHHTGEDFVKFNLPKKEG